ncbi:MAG: HEAT repeat domain-containing protein [Anaerolineae bacterium]|nr:HEAT repeat domain-containing protein [Anaerolineae bacterium]NUQ02475.1 HEAT repeat domain-containing protein [Anaerolineae bacterium]
MTTSKPHPFLDDPNSDRPVPVDFDALVKALLDEESASGVVNPTLYYGLSALDEKKAAQLKAIWDGLDDDYRLRIIEALTEASETNFELDYEVIGKMALYDEASGVRTAAIDLLWENNSLEYMRHLMIMATDDVSAQVRAAAASGLGRFVYAGEVGELPINETNKAQELAHTIFRNEREDVDVRRRALESLSNSSNDNVEPSIRDAYADADRRLNISALYAMGRSCDEEWADIVLQEIDSQDDEIRYEAARAAGELEIREAVPALSQLALGSDREIQEVTIWSLGEIGGEAALRTLNHLLKRAVKRKDTEMVDALEEAIANASLSSGALYMLDFSD